MFVICSGCKNAHSTSEVTAVDIEEDISGRDYIRFVCPVTANLEGGVVFAGDWYD
jgi:hypothetical protein